MIAVIDFLKGRRFSTGSLLHGSKFLFKMLENANARMRLPAGISPAGAHPRIFSSIFQEFRPRQFCFTPRMVRPMRRFFTSTLSTFTLTTSPTFTTSPGCRMNLSDS